MTYPNLTHHGGATGVTGSCHRLQLAADRALLVDCGLFQGQDAESADNLEQHRVTFPVDDVLALIVTHVHIDHIGRLPYLLAAGYKGPILCSVPSARLLPLVIEDALKVGFTRDRKLIERFLEEVHSRLVPLEYQTWHTLIEDERQHVRIRLQRAGHILGSAYVEVDIQAPDGSPRGSAARDDALTPSLRGAQPPSSLRGATLTPSLRGGEADAAVQPPPGSPRRSAPRDDAIAPPLLGAQPPSSLRGAQPPSSLRGAAGDAAVQPPLDCHGPSALAMTDGGGSGPRDDAAPPPTARIVFSGDLGAPNSPLLPAPNPPERADILVLESTYGDRVHEDRSTRQARLKAAIDHALENNGTVVIPAFSIGRTQELLYELENLIHQATDPHWRGLEIIVDSPLAARFTEAYRDLKPYWDLEAHERLHHGRHPLAFENLYTVDSHEEHLQTVDYLARTGRPAVVIAASGMAAGGRVVNYLKRMLGDERHDVLFVGYQAEGTPGRAIQRHGP
ncbi:MBL fold metallo-hydrolase, partial [Thioalkalivibrio sp.]|uniref:MBL fold metallo-hydrolase n=1 Tax=Thioalkalivibrio sp. TaxID=2093813 RepID=UPI0039758B05